ncbi:hypothetical protein [Absidia glauca]|uniref:DNA mismatch repair protein MutS clamp domain-containing protein n=1 Tax=Absidia glauca TaxID=4829 RepID=A0A168PHN5_ABSGL|nr:hypothetical protein [Absidia glauca]
MIDGLRPLASSLTSTLLKSLINEFPSLDEQLDYFDNAFIVTELEIDYRKVTVIIPKEGVNNEWDDLNDQITSMKTAFNKHLAQMKLELKCAKLVYKDMGKEIYQIEVPKAVEVPNSWIKRSDTKTVNRYWNATLEDMIPRYKELLEIKNAYTKSFYAQVFGEFDDKYTMWQSAVLQLAHLDALLGLAQGSIRLGGRRDV